MNSDFLRLVLQFDLYYSLTFNPIITVCKWFLRDFWHFWSQFLKNQPEKAEIWTFLWVLSKKYLIGYSKVPNKRSATFINFRKIFQGLRSYLEGVRLSVLTKYFLKVEKVGFKIPNSMKFILFVEGGTLI